jgi:hypothetical protein
MRNLIKPLHLPLSLRQKNKYVIYRLGGPDRKIFCLGLKNVPRPSTSGRFWDLDKIFFYPDSGPPSR